MTLLDRLRGRDPNAEASESSRKEDQGAEFVEGERGPSAVQRPPSLQSRLTNFLALGLMGSLGIGLLAWYYTHSLDERATARRSAASSAQEKAKGDVILHPLGRVDPPTPAQSSALDQVLGGPPEEPPPEDIPPAWLKPAEDAPRVTRAPAGSYGAKTPKDLLLERLLAGPAFAGNARLGGTETQDAGAETPAAGEMDGLLRPGVTKAVRAQMLPTRRLLLPKGAFIDCTLETELDSTLPGMTTCIMATDAFSADGSVVLLERGTKLVGETRGQVRQGSARVFVLWTEARTPTGVVVPLSSPGTDELGRSGLPGAVNRHFFERFGAAILISVIDGAIQAKVQSEGGGTVILNPNASESIMTEVLKGTVSIPPTVVKPQGDRIQILVARDLDFRSVYELRPVSTRH